MPDRAVDTSKAVGVCFGPPPDPLRPPPPYPGVSAKFEPVAAQKCWAEAIRKEKESRSVHQLLESQGKLQLPPMWAYDHSGKSELLPGKESLQTAYALTGWRVQPSTGRAVQPDVFGTPKRRKRRQPLPSEPDEDVGLSDGGRMLMARSTPDLTGFSGLARTATASSRYSRGGSAARRSASRPYSGTGSMAASTRLSGSELNESRMAELVREAVHKELQLLLDSTAAPAARARR